MFFLSKTNLSILAIMLSVLGLLGCKDTENKFDFSKRIDIVKLNPYEPYRPLYVRIKNSLQQKDIMLAEAKQTGIVTLHILGEKIDFVEITEGRGQKTLTKERLDYSLKFKVTDSFGNNIIEPKMLKTSKEFHINTDNEMSAAGKRDMLTYEAQKIVLATMVDLIAEQKI